MKVKIEVTKPERTMIIAALMAFGIPDLAQKLVAEIDPAEDGPEVNILTRKRTA